jgi:hypothetical protein
MKTVITPGVAAALSLSPIDSITVNGINNVSQASIVIISVNLPNRIRVDSIYAAVCDMRQGIDLLIGMDIIKKGDLAIANGSEKTLFSFAVPPLQNKMNYPALKGGVSDFSLKNLSLDRKLSIPRGFIPRNIYVVC